MALAAILGLAREGSAQFGSAQFVDKFTTPQAHGNASALWVSLGEDPLFAQRQFQRFNNATSSLGSDKWSVGANQFSSITDNGTSKLNYRQNNDGSTIDLSGIASMSFHITVAGSANLYWYLMDASGNDITLDRAILTGKSTQTLDFCTATKSRDFDLSEVTGMYVELSGISKGESATVTNFTFMPLPSAEPLDLFTTAQESSSNGFGAAWVNPLNLSVFAQRQVVRLNSAGTGTASIRDEAWTAFLPRATSDMPSVSVLTYRRDSSYSTINLSSIRAMEFDIDVTKGSVSGYWYLRDKNGCIAQVPGGFERSVGSSPVTLDLCKADIDVDFDLTKVEEMRVWISATSPDSRFSVTNLVQKVIE